MLTLYIIALLQAVVTLLLLSIMLSMHSRVEERLGDLSEQYAKFEEEIHEEMARHASRLLFDTAGTGWVRADNDIRPRAESESNTEPEWERVYRTAVTYPDCETFLTYPHTLRVCYGDDRPDDCPAWRILAELCAELRSAGHMRDD